jgi:release factor glutamine methyltransferase
VASSPSPVSPALVARLRGAGCVFAEQEADLIASAARTPDEQDRMVRRRCAGLPLEHVLGWALFCGLRVRVDEGVFVPRPRTEFLARQARALLTPGAVAVDLCCGSGALGAVLAHTRADITLHAADIDAASVACARRNLPGHRVHQGDLYDALPPGLRGRVQVLVANVPYVPTDRIALLPAEARLYEDRRSLDGGPDGLDLLRRVAAGAGRWLAPGGRVLVEVGQEQVPAAREAFVRGGLACEVVSCPEWEATVVTGTR